MSTTATAARPPLASVLEAMRPRQWIKNTFVLAALAFAGEAVDVEAALAGLAAFAAFCLISGASYLLNDAVDAEADRHNARTASRPVARGDLSPRTAVAAAIVAGALGLALAALLNWETFAVAAGFIALQLAYSGYLKHLLFVDVMAIAAGFVLRAAAGGLAIEVPISTWLLVCTALLAVFLGLTKRRAEAVTLGGGAQPSRPVLEGYSVALLDELIAVVTPATLVSYVVWAATAAVTEWMLVTVPFVLYGIFRVLFLIHHRPGETEEPALVVWRDRALLACLALWGVTGAVVAALAPGGSL